MSQIRAAKFPWWVYWVTLVVIVLFALAPVISVFFTYLVAEANGCQVDEGSVHTCMVMGQDWGELLYATGVMGWLALATVPLGGGALLVWLAIIIIHRIAWSRRQKAPTP